MEELLNKYKRYYFSCKFGLKIYGKNMSLNRIKKEHTLLDNYANIIDNPKLLKLTHNECIHDIDIPKDLTDAENLIMCHGNKHKRKFINALTLDKTPGSLPDLNIDMYSEVEMEEIPNNTFNRVHFEYAPIYMLHDRYHVDGIMHFWKIVLPKVKRGGIVSFSTEPPRYVVDIIKILRNDISIIIGFDNISNDKRRKKTR